MESRAKLFGHALHQQLVVFPLGLLEASVAFDIAFLATGSERMADVAFWTITGGVLTGFLAAIFGLIDYTAIPRGTRAKRIGMLHGVGNVVVLVLFIASWVMRMDLPTAPETVAIVLSFIGVGLAVVTGWLGGELVDRLGVGVDDGAHLNAPSSLSGRPAAAQAGQ